MKRLNILIAGAFGYVGGHLVPRLLDEGYRVRCLARNPEKLAARNWNMEIVNGDVLSSGTLTPAMREIDAAFYLVHAMGSKGDFESRDIESARNFAEADGTPQSCGSVMPWIFGELKKSSPIDC
jgi:uncharacterized protein YbjT (DUF2867 family)